MTAWIGPFALWAAWLLLLAGGGCWGVAGLQQPPRLLSDGDMGLTSVSTLEEQLLMHWQLRAWLRPLCAPHQRVSAKHVKVVGFVAQLPLHRAPPHVSLSIHYQPLRAIFVNTRSKMALVNSISGQATPLAIVNPREPAFEGLWRVEATVRADGAYSFTSGAARWAAPLPHPLCPPAAGGGGAGGNSGGGTAASPQPPSHPLAGGLWNVVTTTSNSVLAPDMLAFLLLQHTAYHRRLGFNGTLLRGNVAELQALAAMPDVQAAVRQNELLLWPWEHEHANVFAPYWWQIPRNQLSLLAAHGQRARLAFLDLDEYLVLRVNGSLHSAVCGGAPLLGGRHASFNLLRYQAKACADNGTELACWRHSAPFPVSLRTTLHQSLCPMGEGHGKHIVDADAAQTLGVHAVAPLDERAAPSANVSVDCAYVLHLFSLVDARRPNVTAMVLRAPPATWTLLPGGGGALSWPAGARPFSAAECDSGLARRVMAQWRRRMRGRRRRHWRKRGTHGSESAAGDAAGEQL